MRPQGTMLRLEILQPLTVGDPYDDLAGRPFLNPGHLTLSADRKVPRWLPPKGTCLYVAEGGELYDGLDATSAAASRPRKRGDLADHVFGRPLLSRYMHTDHAGFIFDTREPDALAGCLANEAELDLPASKAVRLLNQRQRIYLSRPALGKAILEAVRVIGRRNARVTPRSGAGIPDGKAWSLARLFGTIS